MTTTQKGFLKGVIYPLIALAIHGVLTLIISQGWLSATGALALTGAIGWVDANVLDITSY